MTRAHPTPSASWTRVALMCGLTLAASWLVSTPAHADKVRDYTQAADAKGCDLIPLSYERSQCEKSQGLTNKYCKNKPVSCNEINLKDTRAEQLVEERLENHEQCLSYREQVQTAFERAQSKVKKETRNSNPKIAEAAEEIVDKIDDGARDHEQAIRDAKKGIEVCRDLKKKLPTMTGR